MDEPTTYGPGPFTGIAHRIAWQHQEIARLRAALQRIANKCPATCELTLAHEMADDAIAALNIHKHGAPEALSTQKTGEK